MIRLNCSCGKRLTAKPAQAGKTFRCPNCNEQLTVPMSNSPTESPSVIPPQLDRIQESISIPALSASNSKLSIILSSLALALSLFVFLWTYVMDPLGSGISSYDFTTPKSALTSSLKIQANRDFRAMLDLERLKQGNTANEKQRSVQVHKESNYQGKKILFISYTENGLKKNDISSFEKNADSGLWFPSYVSTYNMGDSDIENAIKKWKNNPQN